MENFEKFNLDEEGIDIAFIPFWFLLDKDALVSLTSAKNKPAAHLSLARHYVITGEKEKCLESLEKAREARVFVMPFVAVDPIFDSIRSDPRFNEIVRKMNLAEN